MPESKRVTDNGGTPHRDSWLSKELDLEDHETGLDGDVSERVTPPASVLSDQVRRIELESGRRLALDA